MNEVMEVENKLEVIIQGSGLVQSKAQVLLEKFQNYFEIAADWEAKSAAITVTHESQVAEMKMAREARLFLKGKRIEVEKARKSLKEDALREGQIIDSIARILKNLIEPIEKDLERKEKFAEIKEKQRIEDLNDERKLLLEPFGVDATYMKLGEMPDEKFSEMFNQLEAAHKSKIEAELKAEQERIEKEKAEAAERERIRKENDRLKAERQELQIKIEKEAKEKAEREAEAARLRTEQDARIKAEREAKERAEAELKAKQEAEAKLKAEQAAADKDARLAPDKDKLCAFAKMIDSIQLPEVESQEAKKVILDAKTLFDKVSAFVRKKADEL